MCAVADVGSNSARLLVVRPTEQGHLDVVADARVALRLVRDLDAAGRLSRAALQRTTSTLIAFQTIARRHGARSMTVVATSAIRDAANRDSFVDQLQRDSGEVLSVLSGEEEARLALIGAVAALPVDNGVVVDLGGGSMEIAAFARRRFVSGVTLPLGGLRLGDAHLAHDPPRPDEMDALRADVRRQLAGVDTTELGAAESLVGTGGTIRALAKAARGRAAVAVNRLHGYELRRRDVSALVERLARLPTARRATVPGISSTRAESVLGGALVVEVLMEVTGVDRILVAGYGVRQGVVLDQLNLATQRPRQVRDASVAAVLARLRGSGRAISPRRRQLVIALAAVLAPTMDGSLVDITAHAARLVDAGARLDHYAQWGETANLVTTADLDGFSHGDLAALASVLLSAGDQVMPARLRREARFSAVQLERAGTLLALADDIDRRLPVRRGATVGALGRDGRLEVGGMPAMLVPPALAGRCRRTLHVDLREIAGAAAKTSRGRRPSVAVEFK